MPGWARSQGRTTHSLAIARAGALCGPSDALIGICDAIASVWSGRRCARPPGRAGAAAGERSSRLSLRCSFLALLPHSLQVCFLQGEQGVAERRRR